MSNLKRTSVLACLVVLAGALSDYSCFDGSCCAQDNAIDLSKELAAKQIEFAKANFHGHQQFDFRIDEVACKIVVPKNFANGRPWIWRARFWGHQPQLDVALLEAGWCVCYCDVGNLFGNDTAIERWDNFYQFAQEISLGPKPFLEGMSRGGLIITRWAAANTEKVTGIYADNAVMDIRSWPGGKGTGMGAPKVWQTCLKAYEMTEADSVDYNGGPLQNLEPLANAKIPIIVLINEADKVVPPAENGDLLVAKYKQLNGPVKEVRRPGLGHHPHSLKDPAVLVDFVMEAWNSRQAADEAKDEQAEEKQIRVTRIWNESKHNAFTDIVRWNGKFYCTFRAGQRHVHGDDGRIQLIESLDGVS